MIVIVHVRYDWIIAAMLKKEAEYSNSFTSEPPHVMSKKKDLSQTMIKHPATGVSCFFQPMISAIVSYTLRRRKSVNLTPDNLLRFSNRFSNIEPAEKSLM